MNKDLTAGKPETVLRRFCLPLFASVIFQQLYTLADSFAAGKFAGEDALAAVGNSYEITLIFIAIAFGCNIGCSVTVSQLFGAKRLGEMKTAVYTTLLSAAVLCAVLMTGGLLFSSGLLALIHTPENIFADSLLYLRIYIWGLPFVFYYNIATGIFSALGDSKTPFYFLAVSSVANIGMDILFVAAFCMGVAGVAWATFLCQGVSCVLVMIAVLRRLNTVQTATRAPLFSWRILRRIAAVAVPSMLQQSFVSVGNIIIQSMINSFGSGVVAGYAAAVKLNNLVITSLTTLANGVSNFAAQNLGAGRHDRIRAGFRAGLKLVWILCIPVAVLYLLGTRLLIAFFLEEPSGTALETGILFLHIVTPFYFVVSTKLVADGILRGTGLMGRFMAATLTDLVLRVVLAWCLSRRLGSAGIWMAWPVGWSIAAAMSLIFCIRAMRRGGETAEMPDPAA